MYTHVHTYKHFTHTCSCSGAIHSSVPTQEFVRISSLCMYTHIHALIPYLQLLRGHVQLCSYPRIRANIFFVIPRYFTRAKICHDYVSLHVCSVCIYIYICLYISISRRSRISTNIVAAAVLLLLLLWVQVLERTEVHTHTHAHTSTYTAAKYQLRCTHTVMCVCMYVPVS
jgi:hypothetical protein